MEEVMMDNKHIDSCNIQKMLLLTLTTVINSYLGEFVRNGPETGANASCPSQCKWRRPRRLPANAKTLNELKLKYHFTEDVLKNCFLNCAHTTEILFYH